MGHVDVCTIFTVAPLSTRNDVSFPNSVALTAGILELWVTWKTDSSLELSADLPQAFDTLFIFTGFCLDLQTRE